MKKIAPFLIALAIFSGCASSPENPNAENEITLNSKSQSFNQNQKYTKTDTYGEVELKDPTTDSSINETLINNPAPTMKTSPSTGDTIATIKTNQGDIKILLYTDQAPITTKNFIEHSKSGKYNKTIFHRVMNDFMIQGGDIENKNGMGGYSYEGPGTVIKDEFDPALVHLRGAVSMANRGPNTGGSQFFIVQADGGTPHLNGMHAVFGYAYEGMDVVDKIASLDTDYNDKPLEDVIVESIEITQL